MSASDTGGPHVQVAAFCEKVIVEQGTGKLSLIGLVEQVTNSAVGPEVPDVMPPFSLNALTLAVCIWADQARGRYAIKIRPEDPSGHQLDALSAPIQLEGGPRGVNVITQMNLLVEHEGTYWFDILFATGTTDDGRLLTRVPLEVLYRPQQLG